MTRWILTTLIAALLLMSGCERNRNKTKEHGSESVNPNAPTGITPAPEGSSRSGLREESPSGSPTQTQPEAGSATTEPSQTGGQTGGTNE